jgi:hypothetical protein
MKLNGVAAMHPEVETVSRRLTKKIIWGKKNNLGLISTACTMVQEAAHAHLILSAQFGAF